MPVFTDPRDVAEAEVARNERAAAVHQETGAMHAAFVTLQPLDYNARKRALRWLAEALDNCEVPF